MDEYAVITDVLVETVEEDPPPLHDQTSLEIVANCEYGLTAQETLDASQELYEAGLISYPRTSSHYITQDMEKSVSALLSGSEGTTYSDVGDIASSRTGGATSSGSGGTAPPGTEGTAPPGTEGTAPPDTEGTAPHRPIGKEIFGPYYDEAVRLYKENPDYFPDPDICTIVEGEELEKKRSEYEKKVNGGQLKRGHHRQGLAFGGENEMSNIQHTGESTILRSELLIIKADVAYSSTDEMIKQHGRYRVLNIDV